MNFSLASASVDSFEGRYAFQKRNTNLWTIKPTIIVSDVAVDCCICYETIEGTRITGLPCCPVMICTICCSKGFLDPRCPFCRTDLSDPIKIAIKRSNDDERKRKRCDNSENTDSKSFKQSSSPLSAEYLRVSLVHAPPSPPYSAFSPVYAPESPRYAPPSPPYCPFAAAYFHCTCGNCGVNENLRAMENRIDQTAAAVQNLEQRIESVRPPVNAMENFIRVIRSAPDVNFQRVLEELDVLRSSLSSQTTLHGTSEAYNSDASTVEQNEN